MTDQDIFSGINTEQYDNLKDALSHITILIAGADGEIDEQELNWAEKLTHIRTYAEPATLNDFYADVEGSFDQRFKELMEELPDELKAREAVIVERLTKLNDIFNCLPNNVAFQIYTSLTSFAKHIAKASGGFLRFGSISSEEKHWMGLPMIEPVIEEVEDQAEEESE